MGGPERRHLLRAARPLAAAAAPPWLLAASRAPSRIQLCCQKHPYNCSTRCRALQRASQRNQLPTRNKKTMGLRLSCASRPAEAPDCSAKAAPCACSKAAAAATPAAAPAAAAADGAICLRLTLAADDHATVALEPAEGGRDIPDEDLCVRVQLQVGARERRWRWRRRQCAPAPPPRAPFTLTTLPPPAPPPAGVVLPQPGHPPHPAAHRCGGARRAEPRGGRLDGHPPQVRRGAGGH